MIKNYFTYRVIIKNYRWNEETYLIPACNSISPGEVRLYKYLLVKYVLIPTIMTLTQLKKLRKLLFSSVATAINLVFYAEASSLCHAWWVAFFSTYKIPLETCIWIPSLRNREALQSAHPLRRRKRLKEVDTMLICWLAQLLWSYNQDGLMLHINVGLNCTASS